MRFAFPDQGGDGKVTLSEAYSYAYERTVASTASSAAGAQHPTFSFDLAGNGDLVLTDVSERKEGLRLPAEGPDGLCGVGLGVFFRNPDHAPFTPGGAPVTHPWRGGETAMIAGLGASGSTTIAPWPKFPVPVAGRRRFGLSASSFSVCSRSLASDSDRTSSSTL